MSKILIRGELTTDQDSDIKGEWGIKVLEGEVKLEDLYNAMCDLMEIMQMQIERGEGDTLIVPDNETPDINIDDIDISGFFSKN